MSKEEVPMETIIGDSALEAFRAGLRGAAYAPGDEGYDEARSAWNLNATSTRRSCSWLRMRRT